MVIVGDMYKYKHEKSFKTSRKAALLGLNADVVRSREQGVADKFCEKKHFVVLVAASTAVLMPCG